MTIKLINLKPPLAAWLLLAISAGVHFSIPSRYRGGFACPFCGAVILCLGFGLMIWAWWLFRQSGTPIRPTDHAVTLVTRGPFRFTRNPMYLGIVGMLLGIAVWAGSVPMLIAPVGFLVLMSLVFTPFEERRLRESFGGAFEAYVEKVRRWL
jgi:protein-S-isoprenylcysteine O-methyltransferase Ste14